ncbi:MAG TPA: AAA family ATPase, partial [Archangium sp.]|nr:AAA family ATPase [Archangium sp.]
MIVTRLKLANVRAIETAELSFKPGFNLVVGVNGVGKTTVLETLAVCLASVTKHVNRLRSPLQGFGPEDIRATADALTVECGVLLAGEAYTYLIHAPRHAAVAQTKKSGMPREQTLDTPIRVGFVGNAPPTADGVRIRRPLAVLFSTRRAVPSERAATKAATSGGVSAAFAEAFSTRELRLGEFAAWMRAQKVLAGEQPQAARVLAGFESVVERFLPGYANLRVTDEQPARLLIDRRGMTVQVRQLSDGE